MNIKHNKKKSLFFTRLEAAWRCLFCRHYMLFSQKEGFCNVVDGEIWHHITFNAVLPESKEAFKTVKEYCELQIDSEAAGQDLINETLG